MNTGLKLIIIPTPEFVIMKYPDLDKQANRDLRGTCGNERRIGGAHCTRMPAIAGPESNPFINNPVKIPMWWQG
jgi:hypothetical protein